MWRNNVIWPGKDDSDEADVEDEDTEERQDDERRQAVELMPVRLPAKPAGDDEHTPRPWRTPGAVPGGR
jgi:hypothetical protein